MGARLALAFADGGRAVISAQHAGALDGLGRRVRSDPLSPGGRPRRAGAGSFALAQPGRIAAGRDGSIDAQGPRRGREQSLEILLRRPGGRLQPNGRTIAAGGADAAIDSWRSIPAGSWRGSKAAPRQHLLQPQRPHDRLRRPLIAPCGPGT
ncbi:MAG: hypothetical protein U0800_02485 [Isosphaeraceae bacterium]